MLGSLFRAVPVGRLFGIPVLVMPAVLVLTILVLAGATHAGEVGELVVLLGLLTVSLLAHELGHALTARRMGLRVIDITIWPLGGMARMEGLYDRPSAEAPVALAGPLVNLALAGGCALLPGPLALAGAGINLVLGLGNLVPAFPLDGGRVLRAWLARRSPLTDATQAAVRVGGWAAVCLLLLSATLLDSIGLGLLLLGYVWFTGRMELMQVILRTGRPPSMGTGEVFRRAFRSGDSGQEVHSQPEEPADPRVDELENFRGDLDEFFTGRRR